jgi:type III restriction enzyme
MALHSDFPRSPYAILPPELRWFPAAEELAPPPTKSCCRRWWRGFARRSRSGARVVMRVASATSQALLEWWFAIDRLIEQVNSTHSPFRR